jgi:hypothetical protein
VGDFNLDDKLDLAVSNSNPDHVSVLLGNGDGGFAAPIQPDTGDSSSSVAVGDFNRDGNPDLITGKSHADIVSVLPGNGNGGFGPAINFSVGDGPTSVAIGDFNLDGKLDLATPNWNADNVSVLLNTCAPNTSPTIIATPITRAAGSPSANSQIATVNDDRDALNTLTITVNGSASATVNGVMVSGISVNAAGVVTANIVAACGATTASFTLRVTDNGGLFTEATLNVTVTANSFP